MELVPTPAVIGFVFLLGLVFGSFANVLIHRIPRGESVVSPPSACPACGTKLKPWHNVPLLSWLFLRGKCGFCAAPVSWTYPAVELFTGFLFIAVFLKAGVTVFALAAALSLSLLLALSVIDIRYLEVPDSLNLSALALAVVSSPAILENGTAALLFAGGFALLRFTLSFFMGREAMGEADIMVAATMGALLGVEQTFVAIFLSALLAIVPSWLAKRKDPENPEVPYIPFLAAAALITFLSGDFLQKFFFPWM